jgi:hypothetical protein
MAIVAFDKLRQQLPFGKLKAARQAQCQQYNFSWKSPNLKFKVTIEK